MLPYSTCAICSEKLYYHRACDLAHPDHCHDCWARSMSQGYDTYEHTPPREPFETTQTTVLRELVQAWKVPGPPRLAPSEAQAVRRYMQHLVETAGTGPLADLVTEEGE